jgi:hypothetical protein
MRVAMFDNTYGIVVYVSGGLFTYELITLSANNVTLSGTTTMPNNVMPAGGNINGISVVALSSTVAVAVSSGTGGATVTTGYQVVFDFSAPSTITTASATSGNLASRVLRSSSAGFNNLVRFSDTKFSVAHSQTSNFTNGGNIDSAISTLTGGVGTWVVTVSGAVSIGVSPGSWPARHKNTNYRVVNLGADFRSLATWSLSANTTIYYRIIYSTNGTTSTLPAVQTALGTTGDESCEGSGLAVVADDLCVIVYTRSSVLYVRVVTVNGTTDVTLSTQETTVSSTGIDRPNTNFMIRETGIVNEFIVLWSEARVITKYAVGTVTGTGTGATIVLGDIVTLPNGEYFGQDTVTATGYNSFGHGVTSTSGTNAMTLFFKDEGTGSNVIKTIDFANGLSVGSGYEDTGGLFIGVAGETAAAGLAETTSRSVIPRGSIVDGYTARTIGTRYYFDASGVLTEDNTAGVNDTREAGIAMSATELISAFGGGGSNEFDTIVSSNPDVGTTINGVLIKNGTISASLEGGASIALGLWENAATTTAVGEGDLMKLTYDTATGTTVYATPLATVPAQASSPIADLSLITSSSTFADDKGIASAFFNDTQILSVYRNTGPEEIRFSIGTITDDVITYPGSDTLMTGTFDITKFNVPVCVNMGQDSNSKDRILIVYTSNTTSLHYASVITSDGVVVISSPLDLNTSNGDVNVATNIVAINSTNALVYSTYSTTGYITNLAVSTTNVVTIANGTNSIGALRNARQALKYDVSGDFLGMFDTGTTPAYTTHLNITTSVPAATSNAVLTGGRLPTSGDCAVLLKTTGTIDRIAYITITGTTLTVYIRDFTSNAISGADNDFVVATDLDTNAFNSFGIIPIDSDGLIFGVYYNTNADVTTFKRYGVTSYTATLETSATMPSTNFSATTGERTGSATFSTSLNKTLITKPVFGSSAMGSMFVDELLGGIADPGSGFTDTSNYIGFALGAGSATNAATSIINISTRGAITTFTAGHALLASLTGTKFVPGTLYYLSGGVFTDTPTTGDVLMGQAVGPYKLAVYGHTIVP